MLPRHLQLQPRRLGSELLQPPWAAAASQPGPVHLQSSVLVTGCARPQQSHFKSKLCSHATLATRSGSPTQLSKEELAACKVKELQTMLVELGLPKSGTKEALVNRLLAGRAEPPHTTAHSTTEHSTSTAAPPAAPEAARKRRTRKSKTPETPDEEPATAEPAVLLAVEHAAAEPAASSQASTVKRKRASRTASKPPAQEDVLTAADVRPATASTSGRAAAAPSQAAAIVESSVPSPPASVNTSSPVVSPAQQASDDVLPPLPVYHRSTSWAIHERDMPVATVKSMLEGNPTDLQLTVLGTAAVSATATRALASVALSRGKDVWVFDAGDDTQRQLGAVPHVRLCKLFRIFITSLSPENILGLPGLLCSMSATKSRGHEHADIPVHVYGPEGLAEMLAIMVKVSNTYFEVNVLVVELARHNNVPEHLTKPTMYNKRARIFRAVVPPDQHNPQGYYDGNLASFMPTLGRASFGKAITGSTPGGPLAHDERAGFLPFPELPQGSPDTPLVPEHHMRWTVNVDISARVTAVALPGPVPILSYVYQEADRRGQLVKERAEALGVSTGRDFGKLKDCCSVELSDGRVVDSAMVVTANRPGRKVVIMGSGHQLPGPDSALQAAATGADLLVAGWADTVINMQQRNMHQASHDGCVDARALGAWTVQLGIPQLLLSRFTSMPGAASVPQAVAQPLAEHQSDDTKQLLESGPYLALAKEPHVEAVVQEAQAAATAAAKKLKAKRTPEVAAVCDFWVQVFEKHEGPAPYVPQLVDNKPLS